MQSQPPPSERIRVRRLPQRGRYDPGVIAAIVDEAWICHVATAAGCEPRVIPMFHARIGSNIFLHGSRGSQLLRAIGDGNPVCAAFTLLDGLVLARSAFHHSMNYRSVVLFGRGRAVCDDAEKMDALRALTERAGHGRWNETRPPSPEEFNATTVVALPLDEASAKIRSGPPVDDAADLALPYWAGQIPFRTITGPPIPAADLAASIELPGSVRSLLRD